MKVMTIVGIRPDFIRMSLIIKMLNEADVDHILVHTGQHYTHSVDKIFFEQLDIREPDMNLKIGSGSYAEQTAKLLVETERAVTKIGSVSAY